MSRTTAMRWLVWTALVAVVAFSGTAAARSMVLEESDMTTAAPGERSTASTVWFQGFLASDATGDPINGAYNIVARIYDAAGGGVLLWGPETHNAVTITEGWFNIELGSITAPLPSFADPPYYLSLQVGGETLSPRLKLASVPSALQSATSDLLPFSGAYSGSSDAFSVDNTSTSASDAMRVDRINGTSGGYAIYTSNSGPGVVLRGYQSTSAATTSAPVLNLDIANTNNDSPVVDAQTSGAGPCYIGYSAGPYAVEVYADGSDVATGEAAHVVHAVYDGAPRSGEVVGVYGGAVITDEWGIGGQFRGSGVGVQGEAFPDADGMLIYPGVHGISETPSDGTNVGVWGLASGGSTNYAGAFSGDVDVAGTLTKDAGSFKIDHPLDPANMYLSHSFVESPDMKNVYDGVVTLDASGQATVELPEWFEALNRDFRYQLTCIGGFAPVYVADEVSANRFRIAGGEPGMRVSWQVTGIRQDKYAEAHRIPVEEAKPPREQGTYRHPELYGMPESAQIMYDPRTESGRAAHEASRRRPERPNAADGVDPEDQ